MSGKRTKTSKRYIADKSNVSKTRIVIVFIIILVMVSSIILAITKFNVKNDPKLEIESMINDMFLSLKAGNSNKINKYFDYVMLISSFDPMIAENESDISIDIVNKMFENITWTIEDIDIDENNAIVIVEVTNINFKVIVTDWMKEIVSASSTGVVITNDLALEKLQMVLSKESLETKTIIKKVKLNKKDNKWYIELNDDFRDLVYPGIDSVITVLNENI